MEDEQFLKGFKPMDFYRWMKLAFLARTVTNGNYLVLGKNKKENKD